MQRVSDPRVVRQAFQAIGVPLDRDVAADQSGIIASQVDSTSDFLPNNSETDQTGRQPACELRWSTTCKDLVPRILNCSSPTGIDILSRYFFSNDGSQAVKLEPEELTAELSSLSQSAHSLVNELIVRVEESSVQGRSSPQNSESLIESPALGEDTWIGHLQRFSIEWDAMLRSISQSHLKAPGSLKPLASRELQQAMEHALDEQLVKGLRDAAPWRATESTCFWRLLQRSINWNPLSDYHSPYDCSRPSKSDNSVQVSSSDQADRSFQADPPLISTIQLQSDFSHLRGSWIRYRGTVRRVEYVVRSSPLFLSDGYWLMWLQGADGASQPVGVYTAHKMAGQFVNSLSARQYPEIELVALVGKRLAYASPSGLEIAPTLFAGSIIQVEQATGSHNQATIREKKASEATWQVAFALLIATFLSLSIIIPIWLNYRKRPYARKKSLSRQSLSSRLPIWLAIPSLAIASFFSSNLLIANQFSPPWASSDETPVAVKKIAEQSLKDAFDETQWREATIQLDAGSTLAPDAVLKMLHTLQRIGWDRLWSIDNDIAVGEEYLLKRMRLKGWAKQVQLLELNQRQKDWFSIEPRQAVYVLNMSEEQSAVDQHRIFCSNVPKFWLSRDELWQPAEVRSFALVRASSATTEEGDLSSALGLFAEGPSWLFSDSSEDTLRKARPALPDHWQGLATAGWDLSWIELLREANEKPLSEAETKPFLRLMQIAATGELEHCKSSRTPMEVLSNSEEQFCCCVDWKIRLVSGSRVELSRSDNEFPRVYYQYDGFVKMPGQKVQYSPTAEIDGIVFDGEFPVTIVMAGDSEFLPNSGQQYQAQSWKIGRHARVEGRFYRMWSYRSERLESDFKKGRQLAPLIVGAKLLPVRPDPIPASPVGWFGVAMGIAVVMILSVVMVMVFRDTIRAPS